jgi:hypothetical protein
MAQFQVDVSFLVEEEDEDRAAEAVERMITGGAGEITDVSEVPE